MSCFDGDQFCTGKNPVTKKTGWWNILVGPGKVIDTNIFFVVCTNVLGGCMGTTGPSSINPKTKKPYGLEFPVITIGDMVNVQNKLIEKLGIEKLFAVVGGSMGGMQALEWASKYSKELILLFQLPHLTDTLLKTLLSMKLVGKL